MKNIYEYDINKNEIINDSKLLPTDKESQNYDSLSANNNNKYENIEINQRYIATKDLKELLELSIDDYVSKGRFHRPSFEKYVIFSSIKEINVVKCKKNKIGNKIKNGFYPFMYYFKILSHKCWEKPIYGLLPTFLNQT